MVWVLIMELKRSVRNLRRVGESRFLMMSYEICDGPGALLFGKA